MRRTDALSALPLVLVAACLAAGACAPANSAAVKRASAESARSLAAGDYGKALERQKNLYQTDPGDRKIVAGYVATVEEVKRAGDRALGQGRFGSAQGVYRLLLDRWAWFSGFAAKLNFGRADLEAGMRTCRAELCEANFRQELGAGDYAKALAIYQAALKEYPGDKDIHAGYAKGAGEVAAVGAKALAAKDYALAGKVNGLLLGSLATFEALDAPVAGGWPGRKELESAVRLCVSELTNRGLAEYRKGDLKKAIATWEDLLAFDPENAEIKKAVETARAQLGRLKSMAPRGSGRLGDRRPALADASHR